MPTLINTKLQSHRGCPRIWLEGAKILREGFVPGLRYRMMERNKTLVLTICDSGDYVVSIRKRGAVSFPVIDITQQRLGDMFSGVERLRVVVRDGCIIISIHHHHQNSRNRYCRLIHNLQQKSSLTIGSLFHGGGILDKAVHQGFSNQGIDTKLGIAVELESQYLDASLTNNVELWSATSMAVESGVQYLQLQPGATQFDGVVAGIPCTGASLSGRSKLKLTYAEDHELAGACFFWFLMFVHSVNPAFVLVENVPAYASTASASVIRSVLQTLGYHLQERVFSGCEFGALEDRKRWVLVALSDGLQEGFNLNAVQPLRTKPSRLRDILDPVPPDSDCWKPYDYLADKEQADKAAGKGFRRQLLTPDDTQCGTIGRSYNKARSTEPFLRHPEDPDRSRLFTPREHARLKGIPESVVDGLCTTTAHEVLGQSVVFPVFEAIAQALAKHLLTFVSIESDLSECSAA